MAGRSAVSSSSVSIRELNCQGTWCDMVSKIWYGT